MIDDIKTKKLMARRKGQYAEWLAIPFLMMKGYFPLAKNVQTPFCEIDLIFKRKNMLILVEVKSRINVEKAVGALGQAQLLRLSKGFNWWLSRHHLFEKHNNRIDVLAFGALQWPQHIKDVWRG